MGCLTVMGQRGAGGSLRLHCRCPQQPQEQRLGPPSVGSCPGTVERTRSPTELREDGGRLTLMLLAFLSNPCVSLPPSSCLAAVRP